MIELTERELREKLKEFEGSSKFDYVILVAPPGSGKSRIIWECVDGSKIYSLNYEIAKRLEITEFERLDEIERYEKLVEVLENFLGELDDVAYIDNPELFYFDLDFPGFINEIYRIRHSKPGNKTLLILPGTVVAGNIYYLDKKIMPLDFIRGSLWILKSEKGENYA